MHTGRRLAFTWVELAVVIGVVFLLLALLLPAIQQPMSGRRSACRHNMKFVGLAVLNYANARGVYPGFLNELPTTSAQGAFDGKAARVTTIVTVLPFLERSDIYTLYRDPRSASAAGVDPRDIYLDILACPDAAPPKTRKLSPPPCNFVMNTGRADAIASAGAIGEPGYPADWRANGVFFNRYRDAQNPPGAPIVSISQDYITSHDGSSLTLMLSERLDAGSYSFPPASALETEAFIGFVWQLGTSDRAPFLPPAASQRINGPYDALAINRANPSSNHPGGVNVVFCDGHSRFISQDIDYGVWCLLMTPYGRACNTPGRVELAPPAVTNNYDFLRHTELDESRID